MYQNKKRNKEIVLNYMLKSDSTFFKRKAMSKHIKELTPAQISNGLMALREEGLIERYNKSQTWVLKENKGIGT